MPNAANLETLWDIIANSLEVVFVLIGASILVHGLFGKTTTIELAGKEIVLGRYKRIGLGVGFIVIGLAFAYLANIVFALVDAVRFEQVR